MAVRAMFRVIGKDSGEVRFDAVCDKYGKYKDFFAATPAGEMRLALLNEAALAQFEIGQIVQVDLAVVEEAR